MRIESLNEGIRVYDVSDLSLSESLDCGQCFRWKKNDSGLWCGVVKGVYRELRQEDDGITILGSDKTEFEDIWFDYFDFQRNYDELKSLFSECELIDSACRFAPGIRVLHQDTWEALISFIISQNNNIVRIKGIIDRLCIKYGSILESSEMHAFPDPETLAGVSVEEYNSIGCGYRSQYIKTVSEDVISGRLDLKSLVSKDTDSARDILLKELGIGPKVADCILLYGMGRAERCPADVWMKRVIKALGGSMPDSVNEYQGIAQQFLFHYARNFPEKFVFNET